MSEPQKQRPDRQPIRLDRLMFKSDKPTMNGIRIPAGEHGKGEEQKHDLLAGVHGTDKVELFHLPWMRVFRIAWFRKQTHTGKDGKEIEEWVPRGKPFHVPDDWAVSVPTEEM